MSLSTVETAEAAGISFRRLDYWIAKGAVIPNGVGEGSGSRRSFTKTEAAVVCALADFCRDAARIGITSDDGSKGSYSVATSLLAEVADNLRDHGEYRCTTGTIQVVVAL
jgi:hypothetical protein